MKISKLIKNGIFVFVLSLFSLQLFADQGTTSAVFLKLEQGARPIAMGGAFTAAADDVNSIVWNPAGLAKLPALQLTLMHNIWFTDIFYDYLAGAYPFGEIGTFGLGIIYVNSGEIPRWSELGVAGDPFSASSIGFNIAYGTVINKELSLGVTLKVFNESIDDKSSLGFAADLGAIYKTPIKDLQLGFVAQNLGPQFGFGEAFMLPINVRFGMSYTGIRNMLLNLDYIQPIETYGILALGFEYWYKDIVVLRMGYQFQGMFDLNKYTEYVNVPEIFTGFVMGAGVKIDIYEIDYAYRNLGVLESTHRFGLTLKFK